MKEVLTEALLASSDILMDHYGGVQAVTHKHDQGNVVTDADIESEKKIIQIISQQYPGHSIIAEESGFIDNKSEFIWIIDPLDGTSNFAAGIPWFGSMIALLKNSKLLLAGMKLPFYGDIYFAEKGKGSMKNNKPISVTKESRMSNVLIGYSLDYSENTDKLKQEVNPIRSIVDNARNIRSTNSLIDACYVADGRLGGCVYRTAKVWDVAASSLVITEAGGIVTDARGNPFDFKLNKGNYKRDFSFVSGTQKFHSMLIDFIVSGNVQKI